MLSSRFMSAVALCFASMMPALANPMPSLTVLAQVPQRGSIDLGKFDAIQRRLEARGEMCRHTERKGGLVYDVECTSNYRTCSFTLTNNGRGDLVLSNLERDAKPLNAAKRINAFVAVFDVDVHHR